MACGKKSNNAPTEEFILASPAPVDVAAKISAIYRELSEKVSFFQTRLIYLFNIENLTVYDKRGYYILLHLNANTLSNLTTTGKRPCSGSDGSFKVL